jgi:uncharacterized RDD family membrane protein YckC
MSSNPTDPSAFESAAGEKLIIETPEHTSIEFPLAGIGSRFLALLIDTLIQIGIGIVLAVIGLILGFGLRDIDVNQFSTAPVWIVAGFIFAAFLLGYGYHIAFEAIWNGQTPGKRLTHIRVIRDSGLPITPISAVGRNLLRLVDQLPVFYGIGLICAWISPQSKRIGDYVAGTVVVHEKPLETAAAAWNPPEQAARTYGASRLSPQEYALVEAFLSRRDSLDVAIRQDTAAGILRRIESKLTIPPDRPVPEKLLKELSYERRSTAGYR